jgi:hypothetical protein
MSATLNDHILEAIDRVSDWELPAHELAHVIVETATALAGRWHEDDDLTTSIHTALHG